MFARLRSLLFGKKPNPAKWAALVRWSNLQRNHFADFNGDPIAAVNSELARAGARSECLPVLICADGNGDVRVLAIIKAGLEKRHDCEDALIAALLDESELVRREAAKVLLEFDTIRALAAIVAGNRHGHGIRTGAAQRLMAHGAHATSAIPALFRLLNDGEINWRSHMWAASALNSIGPNALPYLIHAVRYGTEAGRNWAAFALKERGDHTDLPDDVVQTLAGSR